MITPYTNAAIENTLVSLFFNKQYSELEATIQPLLAEHPNWLNGWKILSDTYLIQGKDATQAASQALALNANDANEHCYFGLILKNTGDLIGAEKSFTNAIALNPNYAAAHNNLGIVKKDLGDVAGGIMHYRAALKLNPQYADCFSNLLFCLSHYEQCDAKTLYKESVKYSQAYELPNQKKWPVHHNANTTGRRLNIGFVSADFRDHSIAYCFEPLLERLADSEDIILHAYYNQSIVDDTTLRMQKHFKAWNNVCDWSDAQLVSKIKQDAIDILIDLSGHTAGNRLKAFALKPAPIQVTWFGYLATTGLKAMDYYLADAYLAPARKFDQHFSEKIVQLPVNAPYSPVANAPKVSSLPALKKGYITFACFNRPSKISQATIALWSNLLLAVPNAKLFIGAIPQEDCIEGLLASFENKGILKERLIFQKKAPFDDYLRLHHQVDICLDTYPSSGITTTFHAAWMGVPTLCLAGPTVTSRGAMAIMSHLGLEQFVAQDAHDFVVKGQLFVQNLAELNTTRLTLRDNFSTSAIVDAEMQSIALINAFKQMWTTWCKRKAKRSFSIPL